MTTARRALADHPAGCRVFLVLVLSCMACKPRLVVCEGGQFHEALPPPTGEEGAPVALDRQGAAIAISEIETVPRAITFLDDRHVRTEWLALGHIAGEIDLVFSPEEGTARAAADPGAVFSLKRLAGDGAGRVRFGFRSARCATFVPTDRGRRCEQYTEKPQPMIAEMSCEVTRTRP